MAGEPPDSIRMESHRSIDCNMEEYTLQDDTNDHLSWALEKGSSIGKKILVTGFVLSSAPVVLPPLVVISAFGFAVSIPYGIFLASFACTEKVMSILLPNPPLTRFEYEYESEPVEGAYFDDFEMARKDVEEELEHAGEMVEANGYVEDDENVNGGDETSVKVISDGNTVAGIEDGETKINTEIQGTPIEVTTVVFEENGGQEKASDVRDEEELSKETKGLLEKIKDEGRANDILEANAKGSQEGMSKPLDDIVYDDAKPIGENGDATRNMFGVGNQIQQPSYSHEVVIEESDRQEPAENENLIDERKQDDGYSYFKGNGDSVKPRESKEVDISSVIVIDVVETADSVSTAIIESQVKANGADIEKEHNEEKIREQIDSVKQIVGYKGRPHETWGEELNALYTFVGIESPSSLSDPSDLNEVNRKLQVLMSVVGVK